MTDSIPDGVMSPDSPYARGLQKEADKIGGYHVVPRQLVLASKSLHEISDDLTSIARTIDIPFGDNDLGIIGRKCEPPTPSEYNRVLSKFLQHFKELAEAVQKTGDAVKMAADYYIAQDDEVYRGFEKLDPTHVVPKRDTGPSGLEPSEGWNLKDSKGMEF